MILSGNVVMSTPGGAVILLSDWGGLPVLVQGDFTGAGRAFLLPDYINKQFLLLLPYSRDLPAPRIQREKRRSVFMEDFPTSPTFPLIWLLRRPSEYFWNVSA